MRRGGVRRPLRRAGCPDTGGTRGGAFRVRQAERSPCARAAIARTPRESSAPPGVAAAGGGRNQNAGRRVRKQPVSPGCALGAGCAAGAGSAAAEAWIARIGRNRPALMRLRRQTCRELLAPEASSARVWK